MDTIKISVRNLVLFILRSGSIDTLYIGKKRAQEGTEVHTKLQKKRKKQSTIENFIYESEVSLKCSLYVGDIEFLLEGRADGLIIKDHNNIIEHYIEEIKSTYTPIDNIVFDKNHWHIAQAKFYGYIYSKNNNLQNITIILTYYNIESETTIEFTEKFSFIELEQFVLDILNKYAVFAKLSINHTKLRNETSRVLEFPYESYRKSQRELAVSVYQTIKHEKNLFVKAPTGTGKTISTLFPSIKAFSTNLTEKIFYLTAKTITRQVAVDAINIMIQKGLIIKTIVLYAKDKICINNTVSCNPTDCKYANGHFDRVLNALVQILKKELTITRQVLIDYSTKYCICPFEFAFDICNFCDIIVCDYNYVYDPKVYLKNLFIDNIKNDYVLLNDESHNLIDRSRDMYSATLCKKDFSSIKKLLPKKDSIKKYISKIIENFNEYNKNFTDNSLALTLENYDENLYYNLLNFNKNFDKWLLENKSSDIYNDVLDLYFLVNDFLRIIGYYGCGHVFFIEKDKDIIVKLLCLDSSNILSNILKTVKTSIFFSATLHPLNYFKGALGGSINDYIVNLPSPFKKENLFVCVDTAISTKYVDREKSYNLIADRLLTMVNSKLGNYIVFFPSYVYLEKVYDIFKNFDITTIVQSKALTEDDREAFLSNFKQNTNKSLLAFCVLGGIFSEGIDLSNDRLIGVCIVSVGLSTINTVNNVLMDYYNKLNKNGFDYAYKFPAVNRVLQAGGRVIRTETDRGIIYLIDTRFNTYEYNSLFPEAWADYTKVNSNQKLDLVLKQFWNKDGRL